MVADSKGREGREARRGPRSPWTLLAALVLGACGGQAFTWEGPVTRAGAPTAPGPSGSLSRALAAPLLEVVPARPLVGWLAPVSVAAHVGVPGGTARRLVLRTAEGEAIAITYDLGAGWALPVAAGDALAVRYYPSDEAPDGASFTGDQAKAGAGSPTTRGPGAPGRPAPAALVVATPRGQALAIVTVNDGLPGGVLPGRATIGRSDAPEHVAYTEVRRLPSLCLARIEHDDLALTTDESTVWVSPGAVVRVTLAATPFDFVSFDASHLVDDRCASEDPSHSSWALVAAPGARAADDAK